MAKNLGTPTALMSFDKSFSRLYARPLDSTEIFYSLTTAREYAAGTGAYESGTTAYVGQKIVVIENNVVTHYSIEDEAGTLKELGSKPIGDGDTISISEDGTISLAAIPEDGSKTYTAVLRGGKLEWQEGEIGTNGTDPTGLYKAIADGIQEAKDYADANDTNTTYTLIYGDKSTATGKLTHSGYLVTLASSKTTIPSGTTKVVIPQAEVISGTKEPIQFIVSEAPELGTTYNLQYLNESGVPVGGEQITYNTGGTDSYSSVYTVETTIPSNATSVSSDVAGTVIWNPGDVSVRLAERTETTETNATITYSPANKVIKLVDNDDNIVSSIDATPFIKDGMLHDVSYDATNNTLTFTWNTDSGEKTDTVSLKDLVDTYTAGEGIEITEDSAIKVKVDSTTEEYLSVSNDGIKVSGIDDAISDAVSDAMNGVASAYYTKAEVYTKDETDQAITDKITEISGSSAEAVAAQLSDYKKIINEELWGAESPDYTANSRIDTIEKLAESNVNVIEAIKVNGTEVTPDSGKAVNLELKLTDIADDKNWGEQITDAKNTADNAVTAANSAQSTADDALGKANTNSQSIVNLQSSVASMLTSANQYTDTKIGEIPAATAEKLGLVKVDDVTIKSEEGVISVKKISTDLLEQGDTELVLKGGSAI